MGIAAKKINNHKRNTAQGITECEQVEAALKESEEMFRRFVETSPDLLFQVNRTGRIEYVSPHAITMYGYEPRELIGKHLRTTTPTKEVSKALKALQKVLSGNALENFELDQKDKAGRIIPMEINVVPVCKDGKIVGAQGVMRNITERKRAEEELRDSEERLKILFESAPDGIFLNDMKGTFLDGNKKAEEIIGYKRDELIGKNFLKINVLPKTELPKAMAALSKSIRGKPTGPDEYTLIRKDGTEIPVEISSFPVKIRGKSIALGIARDISERKEAERELQRSYDQLQETLITMVNTLVSTIEIRDPYTAGHQRRVTILACAIAEEMGLPEDQSYGLRMAGLLHDLGKISVPFDILNKPSRISECEFDMIKDHPQAGYNLLREIAFPWPVAQIVLQHHERLDGSGYPHGLKGEEIMLEAKILAVADVVEAMVSHRPYRAALGIEMALEEISKNRGVLYDHEVSDVCHKLFTEKGFMFEEV